MLVTTRRVGEVFNIYEDVSAEVIIFQMMVKRIVSTNERILTEDGSADAIHRIDVEFEIRQRDDKCCFEKTLKDGLLPAKVGDWFKLYDAQGKAVICEILINRVNHYNQEHHKRDDTVEADHGTKIEVGFNFDNGKCAIFPNR